VFGRGTTEEKMKVEDKELEIVTEFEYLGIAYYHGTMTVEKRSVEG